MHTQPFPLALIARSSWFIAFFIVLTQYSEVSAGPFGLEMGMSKEVLVQKCGIKQSGDSRDVFIAERVPSPHPQLETYMLVVDEKVGLCKIIAITRRIETSIYGDQLKGQFDALEKALISKYGTNKRFDYVRAGSIWKEPEDWMTGLLKKERSLVAFWSDKSNSNLSDNISGITLQAKAFSRNSGSVAVIYEFTNFSSHVQQGEKQDGSAL